MKLSIRWNQKALEQFINAIKYIEQDSPLNAEKFQKEILKRIDGLLLQPERYHEDKLKLKNDGTYRAFEKFNYRISYRFVANQIRIIRIRHTKMNPLRY